jgi:hypothetical protein
MDHTQVEVKSFSDIRLRLEGRGIDGLDFLIEDLKTMKRGIDHDGTASAAICDAVELKMLALLDSISPEIRHARAVYERYRSAPKIGGSR